MLTLRKRTLVTFERGIYILVIRVLAILHHIAKDRSIKRHCRSRSRSYRIATRKEFKMRVAGLVSAVFLVQLIGKVRAFYLPGEVPINYNDGDM